MRHTFAAAATFASLILLAHCSQPLFSAEPSDAKPGETTAEIRVARLIRDLGSESFHARQIADDELAKLGGASRKQLESVANDPDPEVRFRAAALVKRIKMDEIWLPGLVNVSVDAATPADVLATMAEQTGNAINPPDSDAASTPVGPIRFVNKPFWEAADELGVLAGHRIALSHDRRGPGFRYGSAKPGRYPTAYSGPLRMQLIGAARSFGEKFDYEDHTSAVTHTFDFETHLVWEDRLRLVAYRNRPEVLLAVTDKGEKVSGLNPSTASWNLSGEGDHHATGRLYLRPAPIDAKRLTTLVLGWNCIAVGDIATLAVTVLADGSTCKQDDVELTIESIEKQSGGRYELSVLITRGLTLPEPAEILFQENRIELLDAQGRAFSTLDRANFLADGGYKNRTTFSRPTPESEPHTLRLAYPRLRSQRELKLVFRDVSLPTAKPE